jgi:CubicO group peptidase (beta-lactamase class C family)
MNKTDRWTDRWPIRLAAILALTCMGFPCFLVARPAGTSPGSQVDMIFARWDKPDSPGCAVAVIQGGSIVYKRGYGMADLDHNIPITPTTIFHAGSLAKQFTAMSIMLLAEQGRVSLDDDVRTIIPELSSFNTRITVTDMLHHLSGIRDQWTLATMAGWRLSDDVITRDDVLKFVSRMKSLNFTPRDQYLYSNTGYTLAAEIVERLSGVPLPDFARDRIFQPLRMISTSFSKNHGTIVKNRAYGYRNVNNQLFELRMPNYDLVGPTNLLTTVEDLAAWDRNFDDEAIGGHIALSQMQTRAALSNGDTVPYGLGLMLSTYRGLSVVEHDGRDAGYRSHLIRFPNQHFAVACLCNLALPEGSLPSQLVRRVAEIYLADQLAPVQSPEIQSAPPPPTGNYWDSWTESLAQVLVVVPGALNKLCLDGDCKVLLPLGGIRFKWGDRPAEVEFSQSGELLLKPEGARALVFHPMPPATLADLAEYKGRFYSDEIDTTYTVEVQRSSLAILRHKYPVIYLEPVFRDGFAIADFSPVLPFGIVRFTRDADRHVTGFLLSGGRTRSLEFRKAQ